jgi:hypothetical protein
MDSAPRPRKGPLPLPAQQRRSERVTLRLTPPERKLLGELCDEFGADDESDLLRRLLHQAAERRRAVTAA